MAKHVMISSTVRDLPEYREQVEDACMRLGLFHPEIMEHLSALDADALKASLDMVDKADLYIGVFAFRYGYVPDGHTISVTEAEYNRAVERNIPRLIFLMDDDHPVKASDVETGDGAEKLRNLKERLKKDRVIGTFTWPDTLRTLVLQALIPYREADITQFHYISDIPEPPEVYIAHPYTLLQTHGLIGRQDELELLTDWVANSDSDVYKAHILSIVAIGGMGKSALTWKWFNDIAPEEMKPLAGRMWWSFYESDATFENFIIRALAYVSRRPMEEVQKISAHDRESQLLTILNREPFLVVFDGLERLLIAYARMDANRLDEGAVGNNRNLRKTADPRAGQFLKKLAQVKNSRVLISTRLHPVELEIEGGGNLPSTFRGNLEGLTDEDAVELWGSFEISGSRNILLPIFTTFGKHPLLIQALAGEIKRYRKAPGDFGKWREANPKFNPFQFPNLQNAMGHVLEFALNGLSNNAQNVLQTIAAFRMPGQYDTLAPVLIGEGRASSDEVELDNVLTELEDRGLLGWDRRANRYDLHPIVRGVVWNSLGSDQQENVYTTLYSYFDKLPPIDYLRVKNFEEITPTIELFNILIGLKKYDAASDLFYKRLGKSLFYRLRRSRQISELMEMLFPDGTDQNSRFLKKGNQAFALNMLGQAYGFSGRPKHAGVFFRRAGAMAAEMGIEENKVGNYCSLSDIWILIGTLYEAELSANRALTILRQQEDYLFNEAMCLQIIGTILAIRGEIKDSEIALRRSLRIATKLSLKQGQSIVNIHLAQKSIWLKEFDKATKFAERAWKLAHFANFEGDLIRAARVQGVTALGLNSLPLADERLHESLRRVRTVDLIEEELAVLIALAELRYLQRLPESAGEFLDDVWEYAERGPYPLFHADALNVLAQIERDAGNTDKAVEAATKAYQLSWCDGPPYAYHWGLIKAQKHLEELGAPLPEMLPFDESKYEPMPEVEINPNDEFHHGTNKQEPDPASKSAQKKRGKRKKK